MVVVWSLCNGGGQMNGATMLNFFHALCTYHYPLEDITIIVKHLPWGKQHADF